jgi:4-carboxymuconolactone decarboxylase
MRRTTVARLEIPDEAAMSPEQKAVCAEAASGPRGRVPAPMIAWLRNPELASRGGRLGELLRFNTSLEPCLSELAILVCARHWTSHHEWTAHKREAIKAGLHTGIIAAIAAHELPVLPDNRALAVYDVSRVLLSTGRVPPAYYEQGISALGERGMVELVAILGYYCMVALTLNTFELGLPGNAAPELGDPEVPGSGAQA